MADLTKVERTWCLELLAHGIEHCRHGSESDRCFALIAFDNALDACALSLLRQTGTAADKRGDRTALFLELLSQRKILLDEVSVQRVIQKRNEIYHNGAGVGVTALFVDMARSLAMSAFEGAFTESADVALTERDLDRAFGATSVTSLPFATLDALSAITNFISRFAWLIDKDPASGWLQSSAGILEEWNLLAALNDTAISSATPAVSELVAARDAALSRGLGVISDADATRLITLVEQVQETLDRDTARVEVRMRFSRRHAELNINEGQPRYQTHAVPMHWTSIVLNILDDDGTLSVRTSDGTEITSDSLIELDVVQEFEYGDDPMVRRGIPVNESVQNFLSYLNAEESRRLVNNLISKEYEIRVDAAQDEFIEAHDAELPDLDGSLPKPELLRLALEFHEFKLQHFDELVETIRRHIGAFYPAEEAESLAQPIRDNLEMWVKALKSSDATNAAQEVIERMERDLGSRQLEPLDDSEEGGGPQANH